MRKDNGQITLEGIYVPRMLGRFRVIRGFALLPDLARVSQSSPMVLPEHPGGLVVGSQRSVDVHHAEAIKRFLEAGELRFIPEVILSARLKTVPVYDRKRSEVGVVSDSHPHLSISPIQSHSHAALREGEANQPRPFELDGPGRPPLVHRIVVSPDMVSDGYEPMPEIRRLDGNHRLHLATQLALESREPSKYLAPFCMVLLGSVYDPDASYTESMLFHTLNSTALPLQSEHALRLVLGQPREVRAAEAQEFATSPELFLTRKLKDKVDALHPTWRSKLNDDYATALNNAAKALIVGAFDGIIEIEAVRALADEFEGAFSGILPQVATAYPAFCKSGFFPELVARCWLETDKAALHGDRITHLVAALTSMARWLGKNSLDSLEPHTSLAQQVFSIYQAIQRRMPKKVFLARWYPSVADGEEKVNADERVDEIEKALSGLRKEGVLLELEDLDSATEGAFAIRNRIYSAIDENEIILIDLSGVRPNVCIEAGYALKNYRTDRLLFLFQATAETPNNPRHDKPPFDIENHEIKIVTRVKDIPKMLMPELSAMWQRALHGDA